MNKTSVKLREVIDTLTDVFIDSDDLNASGFPPEDIDYIAECIIRARAELYH